MDTNILLESGTNELEVLEFTLGDNHYGINVAKIREILQYMPVTPVPNTHPSVEGIFMPRDTMITVINLKNCLGLPQTDEKGLFIITNFNKLNVAFHVDQVIGIHRVSWENIIKPDETISGEDGSTATGVIKMNDRLIVILDFEAIVASISPETGLRVNDIEQMEERDRSDATILIAEDSALLSKLITDCLKKSGYTKLIVTENGQEAWDKIRHMQAEGDVLKKINCIITDIEMPLMDGHRLTKLVKSDPELREIPLIIFSSLVNEEMRRKGEQLGADAQLTKPEIGQLVDAIDKLLDRQSLKCTLIGKQSQNLRTRFDFNQRNLLKTHAAGNLLHNGLGHVCLCDFRSLFVDDQCGNKLPVLIDEVLRSFLLLLHLFADKVKNDENGCDDDHNRKDNTKSIQGKSASFNLIASICQKVWIDSDMRI